MASQVFHSLLMSQSESRIESSHLLIFAKGKLTL
jgi:hypothetical protein